MIFIDLFISFFTMGLVSIGGGLSIIPLLTDILTAKGWMTEAEIIDMIAVSQMTPGPIGINLATFSGFKTAGVLGGVVASIGVVTPSIIIIVIIAHLFNKFKDNPYVEGVMSTIRPVVTGMIAAVCARIAVISLMDVELFNETNNLLNLFNLNTIIIAGLVFLASFKYKVHPVILIVTSAVIGIIIV